MSNVFKLPIRIYYEDTDAGGVVYYANYLRYAERARTEFLRHLGFEQLEDLESADKFAFMIRRAEVDYLRPSRLDDLIEISCVVEDIKGATVEMSQEVICNGEVRVKIKVTAVYISLSRMRPTRVPEEMVKKFLEEK